jgi:hypothetical protein
VRAGGDCDEIWRGFCDEIWRVAVNHRDSETQRRSDDLLGSAQRRAEGFLGSAQRAAGGGSSLGVGKVGVEKVV